MKPTQPIPLSVSQVSTDGLKLVTLSGKMLWPAGFDPKRLTENQRANIAFRATMAERRQPAKLAQLSAEITALQNDFSARLTKLEG